MKKIPRTLPRSGPQDNANIDKADRLYNEVTLLQRKAEEPWWNSWLFTVAVAAVVGLLAGCAYGLWRRQETRQI